ncbi:hypothetical protein, partial [Pseudoalteromonas sp. SG43-3]
GSEANKLESQLKLSDHMLLKDSALSCFDFTFLKVKIITHSQFVFGNKNKNSEFIELSKDIKLFN